MPARRTILVVDPDSATLDLIGPALRRRGHHVHAVADGSRALQHAVARSPDLILLDAATSLIDAHTLVRILRANPRTGQIPIILTGEPDEATETGSGPPLRKPLDADEVAARVEQAFRRSDLARASAGQARLEGTLSQLPLPDLLQVLGANRRTGRITIDDGRQGEIAVLNGDIVDAAAGAVTGEKALFRLLAGRGGRFVFTPGAVTVEPAIARRLDDLLLDGLRQCDELAALAPSLPADDLLVAMADAAVAENEVGAEILRQLAKPRTLAQLLDDVTASDLDASRALAALLERGDVRPTSRADMGGAGRAVLASSEVLALRARLLHGRAGGSSVGKILVAGGGRMARRHALARLATLRGFSAVEDETAGIATLGRLALGDGVEVDVLALPTGAGFQPLWDALVADALAALVLAPAGDVGAHLSKLAAARITVGLCAPSRDAVDPQLLHDIPGGCPWLGNDAAEAVRVLLSRAAAV